MKSSKGTCFTAEDIWFYLRPQYQYLEDLHWFEAKFKIFGQSVFWGHLGQRTFNVELVITTSMICNLFWKFGCQPRKSSKLGPLVSCCSISSWLIKSLLESNYSEQCSSSFSSKNRLTQEDKMGWKEIRRSTLSSDLLIVIVICILYLLRIFFCKK